MFARGIVRNWYDCLDYPVAVLERRKDALMIYVCKRRLKKHFWLGPLGLLLALYYVAKDSRLRLGLSFKRIPREEDVIFRK
jgi:hypothetical protein